MGYWNLLINHIICKMVTYLLNIYYLDHLTTETKNYPEICQSKCLIWKLGIISITSIFSCTFGLYNSTGPM